MRTTRIATSRVGKVHIAPLHGYRTLCGEPLPGRSWPEIKAGGFVVAEFNPGQAPEEPLDPETGCAWCIESLADLRTVGS